MTKEILKIDRTKCMTVANYAKNNIITRQAAYARINSGELNTVEIDGVKFIYLG